MSKVVDKKEVEDLIEILAAYYPAGKQAVHVLLAIQRWAKHLEYPINSLTDLTKRLHTNPIIVNEKHVNLEDITGPVPSYYFPIASYENLVEKVNELYEIKAGKRAISMAMLPRRITSPSTVSSSRIPGTVTDVH